MHNHAIDIHRPGKKEIEVAKKSFMVVDALNLKDSRVYLSIENKKVELPMSATKILLEVLSQIAEGHSFTLMLQQTYLTTQKGADLLNVSRPFFVKLLEEGMIPYQKIGNRRRVLGDDVTKYKKKMMHARQNALQELVDQAQELDLGY